MAGGRPRREHLYDTEQLSGETRFVGQTDGPIPLTLFSNFRKRDPLTGKLRDLTPEELEEARAKAMEAFRPLR